MNPLKAMKLYGLLNKLEAVAKENAPMKVKLPQTLTLLGSLFATLGLPNILTNWVHAHYAVYLGIVTAAIILHALLPSVFAAPSDDDKKSVGLGGVGVIAFLFLFAAVSQAQSTPPAPIQNLYGAGVSYNNGASPAIAGNAIYAHLINDSGTYAFTAVDALPNTIKPLTVNTNVGVGIAQKVATFGKIPIYMPTAAGVSWNGANTGWQWNGGVLAAIHIKNQYYLLPHVRFLKSSVSGGTGYQPIIGVDFGWGQ